MENTGKKTYKTACRGCHGEFGSYQMRGHLCRISRNPDCTIEERYRKYLDRQSFKS